MTDSAFKRSLRIGLLVDSLIQPSWVAAMLEETLALPFVEVALVVENAGRPTSQPRPGGRAGKLHRLWNNRQYLLHAAYQRFERRFYRPRMDPFGDVDITSLVADADHLQIQPRQTKFCDYFEDEDVARILRYDLDVALRLGFRILKGPSLDVARHGVWSYHHGDDRRYRGGPAGFWEVMEGNATTDVVLQILSEQLDAGTIIYRIRTRTDRMSVRMNRANFYWKAAGAVPRKLRELHERGPAILQQDANSPEYSAYSRRLYTAPKTADMARFLGRMATRRIANHASDFASVRQWFLGYRFHLAAGKESDTPLTSYYNFKEIVPPTDRFWADPFPVRRNGEYFLFLEELPYSTKRGHISVLQLRRDGTWTEPTPVLKCDYHLAYPHIFEWEGELYMIPESSESRTVQLYRCTRFPDEWELVRVLLEDVAAVDATPVRIGDRWWMFATIARQGTTVWDDELHLFHAADLMGNWIPHRRNPVKVDVQSARPAGRLFTQGGAWYRPAQNCSESYGHGMTINQIVTLSTSEFNETRVGEIRPEWAPRLIGTHTLNAAPGLTVIDGLRRRRRFV